MARGKSLQIVGRYMSGSEVTAYHLSNIEDEKSGKYSREAVAYLIGKGLITNCDAQLYNGDIILRGKGMKLSSLPVKYESGEVANVRETVMHRRNRDIENMFNSLEVVGIIKSGRETIAYELKNNGGRVKPFTKNRTIELAKEGKLSNARMQNWKDGKTGKSTMLLRGINCDLSKLPVKQVEEKKEAIDTKLSPDMKRKIANIRMSNNLITHMFETLYKDYSEIKKSNVTLEKATGNVNVKDVTVIFNVVRDGKDEYCTNIALTVGNGSERKTLNNIVIDALTASREFKARVMKSIVEDMVKVIEKDESKNSTSEIKRTNKPVKTALNSVKIELGKFTLTSTGCKPTVIELSGNKNVVRALAKKLVEAEDIKFKALNNKDGKPCLVADITGKDGIVDEIKSVGTHRIEIYIKDESKEMSLRCKVSEELASSHIEKYALANDIMVNVD